MKKFLFIILILSVFNPAYAEFIVPVNNIISTKAMLKDANNKTSPIEGEIHFHYNSIYWSTYGQKVADLQEGSYGGFFFVIEFIFQNKEKGIKLKQYYHIQPYEMKKMLTMATNFNKDTYMQQSIIVVGIIEDGDKKNINYYEDKFKEYTDKGKFILEWTDTNQEGIKEQLVFDQAVLLKVWQILLQNTVY